MSTMLAIVFTTGGTEQTRDVTTSELQFTSDFSTEDTTTALDATTVITTEEITSAPTTTVTTSTTMATTTSVRLTGNRITGPCVCDDPPSVANGEATYTGAYINESRAEYHCHDGYTNSGGSSLLCRIYDSGCSDNDWITDPDDPTSGTPNCEFTVGTTINNNKTYNQDGSDADYWTLIAVGIAALLLLLILILLLLWWFCCRECCRRCCVECCPCCRNCCYEIPYARGLYGPPTKAQPVAMYTGDSHHKQVRTVRVSPDNNQHNHQRTTHVETTNPGEITPETYRKRYGYYPSGYASPSSVDIHSDSRSENATGAQPKEFIKLHDEKMELPQHHGGFEPKAFVNSHDDKMRIPDAVQGKPVDTRGQPVWMPHSNNVRPNFKTSTK